MSMPIQSGVPMPSITARIIRFTAAAQALSLLLEPILQEPSDFHDFSTMSHVRLCISCLY